MGERSRSIALMLALGLAACGDASSSSSPNLRSTSQAIIGGTASTQAQDYVVQIAIKSETSGEMIPQCTGTLIAKNLMITARHCVGDVNADDTAIINFAPSKLAIYTGTDAGQKTTKTEPIARGKRTFDNGKTGLNPDIAVVLLDKELDAPIVAVRLETRAVKGESLDLIGYGITSSDVYPNARQQRTGIKIIKTGPGKSTFFDLGEGEFQFGEAACLGDSGGPAIASETGALIGIASRVSNGIEPSSNNPSARCVGTATEDIYTDLTPAKSFIQAAFTAAGVEPWIEGELSPTEKAEAAAAAAAAEEARKKDEADKQAAAAANDKGCSAAAARSRSLSTTSWLMVLASLLLLRRRRRSYILEERR